MHTKDTSTRVLYGLKYFQKHSYFLEYLFISHLGRKLIVLVLKLCLSNDSYKTTRLVHVHVYNICICLQEAEEARKELLELQAIASAVESTGQAKAEAQVCTCNILY